VVEDCCVWGPDSASCRRGECGNVPGRLSLDINSSERQIPAKCCDGSRCVPSLHRAFRQVSQGGDLSWLPELDSNQQSFG